VPPKPFSAYALAVTLPPFLSTQHSHQYMPDTSHPSLGRAESSTLNGTPTPSMSSKTLPNLNLTTTTSNTNTQNNKGGKMAPKVDLEPIYTELKKVVGEGWNVYKEAVTGFMLGKW